MSGGRAALPGQKTGPFMSFLILLNLLMFRFRIRESVEGAWAPDMGLGEGAPKRVHTGSLASVLVFFLPCVGMAE